MSGVYLAREDNEYYAICSDNLNLYYDTKALNQSWKDISNFLKQNGLIFPIKMLTSTV